MLLCVVAGLVACGDKECDHSYGDTNVTNPTCTEQGYTTFICTKCGDSYDTYYVDVAPHTYGEKIVIKEPSCTENGQSKEICTVCKFENIISTDATGHSFKNGFCSICSATDQNSSALIDGTEVNNLSITEQGVLSWAKMKIASKYTLEVTTSDGTKIIEIKKEDAFVDFSTITDLVLDYGNNACTLTVYEWQTYEEIIDGETVKIEEHIPVGQKNFNIVNLNGGKSISILQFEDERISVDGFDSKYHENDIGKYLYGEVVLTDKNSSVSYRIDKQIKLPEGYEIAFYSSRYDRDNGHNPLGSIAVSTQKVKAGNNWFFANVMDAEGNVYAYDFLVMGVTYADLFVAKFDRTLDGNGDYIPSYTYLTLENNKVLQNGYIDINVIYELIPDGYILRDNEWNIYEKNGDYIVPVADSFSLYYAPIEEVLAEKAELDAYKQWFNLTLYMDGYEGTSDKWILSVRTESLIRSLVIPYRIIGNEVMLSSSSFYNAKLSTVTIAPGYTSLPSSLFSSVESLSTLNIPSTVTSLGDWMFNAKFADTLKIYCESSMSNGRWNQISGTTRYFTTYINATGAASSTICDGYTARITPDGAYIVSCDNGTTAPIPKTVIYGIIEYPVVGLYEGALSNYAGEDLFIDKGITSLYTTSFGSTIAKIIVDEDNPSYASQDGILYDKELSSIIFVPYKVSGNITLPQGVTSLAEGQFKDRTMLTGINTANVRVLPNEAFYGCSALSDVVLPSVVHINNYAFYGCYSINTLTISSTDISFGTWVFEQATIQTFNYVGTVNDWANTTIGAFNSNPVSYSNTVIFAGTELVGDITISGISKINDYVFSGAKITALTIGADITEIGESAFSSTQITTLNLGSNVAKIGKSAFAGIQITSLTLPASLTIIGDYAFMGVRITALEIPSGVTTIGEEAFYNCGLLTKLAIYNNAVTIGRNAFLNTSVTEFHGVTLPEGVDASKIKVLAPVGATTIVKNQYYKYTSLCEITIPNTVTAIEQEAFSGIATLKRVMFEANSTLTKVGYKAFSGCTGLVEITLPYGVTTIGGNAFENCSSLVEFIMPDSVTNITSYIFYNCSSLEVVKFSRNMSECVTPLFGCGKLKEITISASALSTYSGAYSHLGNLFVKNELSPYSFDGAVEIEHLYNGKIYKFYVPSSLEEITITGNGVLVSGLFENLTMVKEIVFENGQTAIPESAFENCSSLESITIDATVITFGANSLNGCTSLKKIYYTGTEDQWNSMTKSTDVIAAIHAGITVIYNSKSTDMI